MGRLKVLCCGYRDWALDIFYSLIHDTRIAETPEALEMWVREYNPDVVLLVGWSWIVPEHIWKKKLTLCLHPSPLPKYRGGSPIQHQIINGETKSAVTLFVVDGGIDTGDILGQRKISLEGSLETIFDEINREGFFLIRDVLGQYPNFKRTPQKVKTKIFKRRTPAESELKPEDFKKKTARQIYDFIRALDDPYPNAFIVCGDGKKVYLKGASLGT